MGIMKQSDQQLDELDKQVQSINNLLYKSYYMTQQPMSYIGGKGSSKYDEAVNPYTYKDLEDIRGEKQGTFAKWGNGLVKGLGTAVSTAGETFANMADLPGTLAGRPSEFGNTSGNLSDMLNSWLQESFPTYYTEEQKKQNPLTAWIPFSGGSTNFWSDKVLNGLGFTAGTIISGMMTAGISDEVLGITKAKKALDGMRAAINAGETLNGAKTLSEIEGVAKRLKFIQGANSFAAQTLAASTEAKIEARQGADAFRKAELKKIQDSGRTPTTEELTDIEKNAQALYNVRWAINLPIVGLSNFIQFGKLFTRGYSTERKALGEMLDQAGKMIAVQPTKAEKVYSYFSKPISEALQEEEQFTTERALQDYYDKKFNHVIQGNLNDMVNSAVKGFQEAFGSTEGLENGLLGLIIGGIGLPGVQKTGFQEGASELNEKYKRTQAAANFINNYNPGNFYKAGHESIVTNLALQKQREKGLAEGDLFKYKNAKDNQLFTISKSFYDTHQMDRLKDQIKSLPDTKEDLARTLEINEQDLQVSPQEFKQKLLSQVSSHEKILEDTSTLFSFTSPAQKDFFAHLNFQLSNLTKREQEVNDKLFGITGVSFLVHKELEGNLKDFIKGIEESKNKVLPNLYLQAKEYAQDLIKINHFKEGYRKAFNELLKEPEKIDKAEQEAKKKADKELSKDPFQEKDTSSETDSKEKTTQAKSSQKSEDQVKEQTPIDDDSDKTISSLDDFFLLDDESLPDQESQKKAFKDSYKNAGSPDQRDQVFEQMKESGLKPDPKKHESIQQVLKNHKSSHRGTGEFTDVFNPEDRDLPNFVLQKIHNPESHVTLTIVPSKNPSGVLTDLNSQVQNHSGKYDVYVYSDNQFIGFLPQFDRFAVNKKVLDPNLISEEDYKRLFNPDPEQSFESFKKTYLAFKEFYEYIDKLMESRDNKQISLDMADLSRFFNISVTPGEFDVQKTDLSVLKDSLNYINDYPVIVSRLSLYDQISGKKIGLSDPIDLNNDLVTTDGVLPEYQDALQKLKEASGLKIHGQLESRYVALAKDVSGPVTINGERYSWIALSPKRIFSQTDLVNMIQPVRDIWNKSFPNISEQAAFNQELSEKVFISSGEGFLTDLQLTFKGDIHISFKNRQKQEFNFYHTGKLHSITELVNYVNSVIKADDLPVPMMKETDFRVSVPQKVENPLEVFESQISENIKRKRTLRFSPKKDYVLPDIVPQEEETPEKSEEVIQTPEEQNTDFPDFDEPAYKTSRVPAHLKIEYNKAFDYLKSILPNSISVDDLSNLKTNLEFSGILFGTFKNSVIYLSKDAEKGTEYHEAFHAVFRSFLSEKSILHLLDEARNEISEKDLQQRIDLLQEIYPKRVRTSLTSVALEEYLADKFQEWKLGKPVKSSFLARVFQKIIDWIKFLTSDNDIEKMFYKIDLGGFKSSKKTFNRFTNSSEEAWKLAPITVLPDGTVKYLTNDRQNQIVNTLTALIYKKSKENKPLPKAFSESVQEMRNSFNPDQYSEVSPFNKQNLKDVYWVLSDKNLNSKNGSGPILKEAILAKLKSIGYTNPELEEDNGESKERNRDLNQENIGGFGSLSKFLREYISLTTYTDKSTFGVPITLAVDPKRVYDGIARYLSNTPSMEKLVRKMAHFREISEMGKHFIDKFFTDCSIDTSGENIKYNKDKENLYHQVLKAFNLYSVEYIFAEVDPGNLFMRAYSSNRRNADSIQVNRWKDLFGNQDLSDSRYKDSFEKMKDIHDTLRSKNFLSPEKLNNIVLKTQKSFKDCGIELSRGYIKYMILSNPERMKVNSADQNDFVLENKINIKNSFEYLVESIDQIKNSFSKSVNPFIQFSYTDSNEREETGSVTRLKNLALDNALFDETIYPGSYTNAEGKSIYELQQGTSNAVLAIKLREYNPEKETDPWKQDNFLANSPEFTYLKPHFEIQKTDGLRQTITKFLEKEGDYIEDRNKLQKEGLSFGKFGSREFLLYSMALYASHESTEHFYMENGQEKSKKFRTYSVPLNIMEASNTLDLMKLPLYHFSKDGEINQRFKDFVFTEVLKEYNRIQNFDKVTDTILDYNTGMMKGKSFWMFKDLLGDLTEVLKNKSPEEIKDKIHERTEEFFKNEVNSFIETLDEEGIITKTQDGDKVTYKNRLLDSRFFGKSIRKKGDLFNSKNFEHNIMEFFLNNFVNTYSYNQLVTKDPSFTVKDQIDWFKRAKGINASGPNLFSSSFQDMRYIVWGTPGKTYGDFTHIDEPVETSKDFPDESIKLADAQGWGTKEFFIQASRSLGRLDSELASIYDNVLNKGKKITKEEWEVLKKKDGMLNPKKIVGFDPISGQYLKLSIALLDYSDIAEKKDGKWIPKPGFEFKFNMLKQMEEKNVHLAGPPSMSKMLTRNPVSVQGNEIQINSHNINTISTEFVRLQQENPSNKVLITEPSQMLQIIDSEQKDELPLEIKSLPDIKNVGQLRKFYQDQLSQRAKIEGELYSNFIWNSLGKPNLGRFQRMVYDNLQKTGASDQLLDFFRTDEAGNPLWNAPNLPTSAFKFKQLFLAHFNKVFRPKIPGYKVTLESGYGHPVYELDGKILTQSQYNQDPVKYRRLYNEGKMVARELAFNKQGPNGLYSEVILPYHFAEQFNLKPGDDIPEEISSMFGVRIPSQDKHSGLSLKVVDIRPAHLGSSMIFPKEMILLTGSDFDIDSFYIHRFDAYFDDGGNSHLYSPSFEDYIRKMSSHPLVKELDSQTDPGTALVNAMLVLDEREDEDVFQETLSQEKTKLALRTLGFPYNKETFEKFKKEKGEINLGVINNNLLRAKIALHTNKGVQEIAKTPASLKIIEEVGNKIAVLRGFKSLKDMDQKFTIWGLNAQVQALHSNKAGQKAVGAAVNSLGIYTFLNKGEVQLNEPIKVLSKEYSGFNKRTDDTGRRIMDTFSTFVSAETDNPKYNYVSKLGITIEPLSTLSVMTALGVSPEISLMIRNTPYVDSYVRESERNAVSLEDEMGNKDSFLFSEKKKIYKLLDELKVQWDLSEFPLTKEDLENSLRIRGRNSQEFKKNYESLSLEDKKKFLLDQLNLLDTFREIEHLNEFYMATGGVIKLTTGIGTDFDEGDKIEENLEKIQSPEAPFNINAALESHGISKANLDLFKSMREKDKSIFIERTDLFQRIKGATLSQLKENLKNKEKTLSDLRRNLLSFLEIKAFDKLTTKALLNRNSLLFPSFSEEKGLEDLWSWKKRLTAEIPWFQYNSAIKNLEFGEKFGMLDIKFNTRTRGHQGLENMIINGFDELWKSPETRDFMETLFEYLIARDGFQFRNNSFQGVLPSYFFRRLDSGLNKIQEVMSKGYSNKTEEEYINLFGNSQKDLFNEFTDLFLRDRENQINLPFVKTKVLKGSGVKQESGVLTFDLFQGYKFIPESIEENIFDEMKKENAVKIKSTLQNLSEVFAQTGTGKEKRFVFPKFLVTKVLNPMTDKMDSVLYELDQTGDNINKLQEPVLNSKNQYLGNSAKYKVSKFIGVSSEMVYTKSLQDNVEAVNQARRRRNEELVRKIEASKVKQSLKKKEAIDRFKESLESTENQKETKTFAPKKVEEPTFEDLQDFFPLEEEDRPVQNINDFLNKINDISDDEANERRKKC